MTKREPARTPAPPYKLKPQTKQPEQQTNGHSEGPVERISMFPISASIWMKYSADGRPWYSVSFQRTYKNDDGKWEYTTSFNHADCLILAQAAERAYHLIESRKRLDRQGNGGEDES